MFNRTFAAVLVIALLGTCWDDPAGAAGKKHERSAVLEVPTPGKIVDVVYQPEFDEWWVKCREGDTICVYSYDPRAREWGKIHFVPKKPDDTLKTGDKPKPSADADRPREEGWPDKVEEPKHEPPKDPTKGDRKTDAKWWDPFKILKQGERLIRPPRTEGNR